MTTLGPESRALITAARRAAAGPGEAMTPADKARIRRKLAQQIGVGLAAGTAFATTATVAKAAPASWLTATLALMPGAVKVVGAVALSMAVGATVVDVTERVTERVTVQKLPRSTPARVTSAGHANSHPESTVASEVTRELGEEVARAEPELHTEPTLRQTAPVTELPVATVDSPPREAVVDDALIRQVSAIREARAAIRRGDATAALRALDTLSEASGGSLEQEVLLARVTALCLKGDRSAARRVAEQLLARFEGSPHAPQLRTTCAFSPESQP